jgi:hypothetical protein
MTAVSCNSPQQPQASTTTGVCREMDNRIDSLGPWDILCGRSRNAYHNVGNRRFRITICLHCQRYMEAKSREEKGVIITTVLRLLKDDVGARFVFLSAEGGFYVEISENEAQAKVSHALRDMTAAHRRVREAEWRRPHTNP